MTDNSTYPQPAMCSEFTRINTKISLFVTLSQVNHGTILVKKRK